VIRLVALDLDGTLLGPDSKVSETDAAAVIAARDRGVHIVLCTARWHGVAVRTARRLELHAPIISHNGAQIQEPDGEELFHATIHSDTAREIAAFCDAGDFETYTTVDGITYMRSRWEANIDPARLPKDMRIARTHAEHVTAPATGLIVFTADGVRSVVETFAAKHPELAFVEAWSDNPYVTVTAAGVDKGTGLRFICKHLDVPEEESMAMGDATPDIDMFRVAGIAVAMGNGTDDVKATATATAPSNEEGGVAWAIRKFVLEEAT
jgi:Cof subfamily protein (haloacid dehalogenase superfamily)